MILLWRLFHLVFTNYTVESYEKAIFSIFLLLLLLILVLIIYPQYFFPKSFKYKVEYKMYNIIMHTPSITNFKYRLNNVCAVCRQMD